ncbi:protein of unknown function [Cupriavidus taiwanensis]|uniref:Uncharacterized protein n=1 Tax=Cupriavidus taiwanensis TaxID=164546 RepID=A0A375GZW9_9BURK|nr:hypothetical protein CBM2592_A280161 [Cupriavidus taiwanensis]SOY52898.1 hypothetical protein CBM2588_A240131 [Cupriavidus taiwanensis]SOY85851.1 hypothetical protein CBM2591_A320163 [Cupriavidus taiwanensis]SPA15695.1 hypothetical protein CBM2631_A330031 [Cupriavidus taiwanensis]SPD44932.1 conserved protein of unknown function [Cupriavidus taiwanensis]
MDASGSLVFRAFPARQSDFSTKLSTGALQLVENQSSIIDLGPHLKFYFKLMLRRTPIFRHGPAGRQWTDTCLTAMHLQVMHAAG